MASAEKGSSRSAGRTSSGSKARAGRTSSGKPSGPKTLHSSARKQTSAVARGGAGQKASKKSSAGPASGRKTTAPAKKGGALKAVGSAVRSVAKKVTSALKPRKASPAKSSRPAPRVSAPPPAQKARTIRRASDVDASKLDDVSGQSSAKGPFDSKRSDAFRQQDIDSAFANRNEEFADEDHLTNRSGNKRIGTKNRKYE